MRVVYAVLIRIAERIERLTTLHQDRGAHESEANFLHEFYYVTVNVCFLSLHGEITYYH